MRMKLRPYFTTKKVQKLMKKTTLLNDTSTQLSDSLNVAITQEVYRSFHDNVLQNFRSQDVRLGIIFSMIQSFERFLHYQSYQILKVSSNENLWIYIKSLKLWWTMNMNSSGRTLFKSTYSWIYFHTELIQSHTFLITSFQYFQYLIHHRNIGSGLM